MSDESLLYRLRSTVTGSMVFILLVAGGTYYLQKSLIVVKHYGPYSHWAVVLIAMPALAGLVVRISRFSYPLLVAMLGACASAALLYPQYKTLWAQPPSMTNVAMYVAIVLGIGFIATQPLTKTIMIAFRLGRYSIPRFSTPTVKSNGRKAEMTHSQRLQSTGHANMVAMLELLVGLSSLGLSIFSVFFLGRG